MKPITKAADEPQATNSPEAALSGSITPIAPLGSVIGSSAFYANLNVSGSGPIESVELLFDPPAGVPVWLGVACITGFNFVQTSQSGLKGFKATAEVFIRDGMGVLKISGEMSFHPQPPDSSLVQQIDVFGRIMFYGS